MKVVDNGKTIHLTGNEAKILKDLVDSFQFEDEEELEMMKYIAKNHDVTVEWIDDVFLATLRSQL